jgi:RNA polymerase sigma factor (sigma-70 family)
MQIMTTNNRYNMSYVKAVDTNTSNLLSAFQKGSIEAFSQLYDLYANVLFNYGCKLTNDRELLKDCIHDVFIKIYNKREELHNVLNFKSYLFVSLRNKLYDEMRKNNRLTERQIDDYQPVSPDDVEVDYISSEKKELVDTKVSFLLDKLSSRQREAITLYYLEERKYDDICNIMGINYQSVRNLIYRGLTKLRTLVV